MSRLPLISQRVPLYLFLPVIVACGAAGYIAHSIGPLSAIFGQAHIHRPAEFATTPKELLGSSTPPRDARFVVPLPADELDLPTPAPRFAERNEQVPANAIEPAPPSPVTKVMRERPRATRAGRSASKPHRPQRVVRQPTSTPATVSSGLKNIPLIGPVFSLFQ